MCSKVSLRLTKCCERRLLIKFQLTSFHLKLIVILVTHTRDDRHANFSV